MKQNLFKYGLCFLMVCLVSNLKAQQNDKNYIIQQRIELIAEQNESETTDYTTLVDLLNYYYDNPINLNETNREELESLNLLTSFQISSILSYTRLYGSFKTIYELRTVETLDTETIQNILPFVQATPQKDSRKISLKNMIRYGKNDLFLRYTRILEEKEGFSDEIEEDRRYKGDANKYYARYRYQYMNKFSLGVTAEKDAGEYFFEGENQQGFDYYSAHLFYQSDGLIRKVAVGDFQAQFGQGLNIWSGLSYGKSPEAVNVVRYASKLRPYTSVNENQFLRGAGVTLGKEKWELTTFFSQKGVDANIVEGDTLNDRIEFSSLQTTGLHRTQNEIDDKNSITERVSGGNLTYTSESFKIGATAVYSEYIGSFNRSLTYYNQFEFNNNSNLNAGFDFMYMSKHYLFFGEASRSENGGLAYLSGVQIQPDPRVNFIYYHRNFDRDYQNLFADAIAESSRNQNEIGNYFGTKIKLTPSINLTGYFDLFKFEWLRYQVDAPSDGADYSAQLNWKAGRYTDIYFRYRNEEKLRNSTDENLSIDQPVTQIRSSFRVHLSHKANRQVTLKSRVEFSKYELEGNQDENGLLLYQDVQYKTQNSKWAFTGRLALFDVKDYNARIYAYENDVLYAFSVPAYYNRGMRAYFMTRYEISKGLKLWVRIARSYFSDQDTVGTGLEEIDAPHRTELKVQLRYKF